VPDSVPTIMVIDDEPEIRDYLREVLSLDGYDCKCFRDSLGALGYLNESPTPDLVLTDIRMPGMDGLELLKQIEVLSPGLPVVLISGLYELAVALEALRHGAVDYLLKPARPAEVLSLVAKHVGGGRQPQRQAVQSALERFVAHYRPGNFDPAELFDVLGFRRYETMQHSLRVAAYAVLFGSRYGLDADALRDLELGGLLHDIGKIGIPRNVILKPGPLNDKEREVIRTHTAIGFELLAGFPELAAAAEVVYGHHERYDGKGYPRGLAGDVIPIGARLFSIVDTVDAITSDRPYRAAQGFDAAQEELRLGRGDQFDSGLVDLFFTLPMEDLVRIQGRYPDTPSYTTQGRSAA